ncbi:MAG: SIMPL domain-containing protein [Chloroflexota bacterium]|nr:SIMPL domain-containing protein [Chloroflexota bacterium]
MARTCRSLAPAVLFGRLTIGSMLLALVAGTAIAPAAAQPLPDDVRTIVVTGTGVATAPAETARIQFLIATDGDIGRGDMPMSEAAIEAQNEMLQSTPVAEQSQFPSVSDVFGPVVLTEEDLAPVILAVIDAGAPEDAITVQTGPAIGGFYGPGAPGYGLVEILLPDPTLARVNAIVEAANSSALGVLALQSAGVEYNVADCGSLLDAARQAAFDDARARAEALAPHIGASVGAPVQVNDFGTSLPQGGTSCPPTPDMAYGLYGPSPGFNTPPFNGLAPAEARVVVQLSMTYEFELARQ